MKSKLPRELRDMIYTELLLVISDGYALVPHYDEHARVTKFTGGLDSELVLSTAFIHQVVLDEID